MLKFSKDDIVRVKEIDPDTRKSIKDWYSKHSILNKYFKILSTNSYSEYPYRLDLGDDCPIGASYFCEKEIELVYEAV